MKKIKYLSFVLISILLMQSCEENYTDADASFNYVAFGSSTYSTGVDPGGNTSLDVNIFTSTIASSDVAFNVTVDASGAAAGSYDVPSTVTVPAGTNKGTLTIGLSDVNLGIGVNKLVLNFENVAAGYGNGSSTTIEYIQNCTEVTATLDLTFDRWGSEVSWQVKDALGGVVASGGGYPDTGSGTSTSDTKTFALCSGRTYTLVTTDAYGDGWGSVGNYTLTIGGVVKVSGDGSLMDNGGSGSISSSAPFDTN